MPTMKLSQPIIIPGQLFEELDVALLALLRGLAVDEWNRPTVCSQWTVKDIAAHLLDGSLRRLSIHRDRFVAPDVPKTFDSYQDLVG